MTQDALEGNKTKLFIAWFFSLPLPLPSAREWEEPAQAAEPTGRPGQLPTSTWVPEFGLKKGGSFPSKNYLCSVLCVSDLQSEYESTLSDSISNVKS